MERFPADGNGQGGAEVESRTHIRVSPGEVLCAIPRKCIVPHQTAAERVPLSRALLRSAELRARRRTRGGGKVKTVHSERRRVEAD